MTADPIHPDDIIEQYEDHPQFRAWRICCRRQAEGRGAVMIHVAVPDLIERDEFGEFDENGTTVLTLTLFGPPGVEPRDFLRTVLSRVIEMSEQLSPGSTA